ncbi:MAG: hypothetical protein U0R17_04630 [Acidimicrobiia bacterium]
MDRFSELAQQIYELCRLEYKGDEALKLFRHESIARGDQLAADANLPDMVLYLNFAEQTQETHAVLKDLAKYNSQALASNPNFGLLILTLCKLNQTVEAVELLVDVARDNKEILKFNESMESAYIGLDRKDATEEAQAIAAWLDSGDGTDFPEFPRLERIQRDRASGAMHATTGLQPRMGLED